MRTNKRKGSDFERYIANTLKKEVKGSVWRRIPGSGALGTILHESSLQGDVFGFLGEGLEDFSFSIEAKYGYGGDKQITFKRDWIAQAKRSAESIISNPIPVVVIRFKNAKKNGVVYCFEQEDFIRLLRNIIKLRDEYEAILLDCEEENDED